MHDNSTLVAFCVPTFKRPGLLKQCILAIDHLVVPEKLDVIIIVVDNDAEQSAKTVCDDFSSGLKIPLHYYVEVERGLCCVRNCMLEKALQHKADLLAFIDDDEMPHKDWLKNIYTALVTYAVDIATGPVISIHGNTPPADYELKQKYQTGDAPRYVSSNNVIFKQTLLVETGLTFDPYYNFMGGEDFDFFARAKGQGFTSVWTNDAVVFETLLPERETVKYKFYRHYSGGVNNVLRHKRNYSSLSAWLHFSPKLLGKFIGAIISLFCAIFSKHGKNLEKSSIKFASALGYLAGLLNIIHERYRY